MKKIIFLLSIVVFSCNSIKEANVKNIEKQNLDNVFIEPKITGEKYFDYDEIEYYKSKINEGVIRKLYDNKKKSIEDSLKMAIILGEIPKSVSDTNFISYLKTFGYSKSKIESKYFKKINEVFTEKKHSEYYVTTCVYIYRDILIFKRKFKTVGIAKICFDCDANVIVGTKSNTEEFGMSGDYEKLKKILDEK